MTFRTLFLRPSFSKSISGVTTNGRTDTDIDMEGYCTRKMEGYCTCRLLKKQNMLKTAILLSDSFVISIGDVYCARARQLCASQRYMSILAWARNVAMGRYMRSNAAQERHSKTSNAHERHRPPQTSGDYHFDSSQPTHPQCPRINASQPPRSKPYCTNRSEKSTPLL